MAKIKVFLHVYDNEQDQHHQDMMLGWMDSKHKEKFLSKLTSTKFIEQSCFSDIQYDLLSEYNSHFARNRQPQEQKTEYYQLVIHAYLNPQRLEKCSTFAGCAWGCIHNMVEACAKEHKRFCACKNKSVVNMLFKNKLILDNKQNIQ